MSAESEGQSLRVVYHKAPGQVRKTDRANEATEANFTIKTAGTLDLCKVRLLQVHAFASHDLVAETAQAVRPCLRRQSSQLSSISIEHPKRPSIGKLEILQC